MRNSCLFRHLCLPLIAAALAGCATPLTNSRTVLVPIAGGKTTEMSFGRNGPVMRSGGGVQIVQAGLGPTLDKKHLDYVFEFAASEALAPRHVTVEDVSEDPVQVLVDDKAPHLVAGHWKTKTPSIDPRDSNAIWVTQLDDTIRVFRFTVVLGDGTRVVLDQAAVYPGPLKAMILKAIGFVPG